MMRINRDAPTGAATSAGAGTEKAAALAGSASNSFLHYSPRAAKPQGVISKYLLCGQQNAVTLRQIVKLSELDNRTARRMIEIERRMGTPICSNNQTGYYLAADATELERFIRSMQHRAGEIWKTARALDDTLKHLDGQERMEGF